MRVIQVDISNAFDSVIATILNLFAYVFNQMGNITFHNTSILMVMLGLTILGIAIPIFLTISKSIVSTSERIRPKGERTHNDN